MSAIYLDCNSTTPLEARALEAMAAAWRDFPGNPASQHGIGRRARRRLEEAREAIGELLGAKVGRMDADRVVFTSGGTEANCLAVLGITNCNLQIAKQDAAKVKPVLISAIEHPSAAGAAEEVRRRGGRVEVLPVGNDGIVDFGLWIEDSAPHRQPAMACVMLANNETGIIQPVVKLAPRFQELGAIVHTDAAQAVGKIPVHFGELGVDALSVAPHKFHGPVGIGALVLRHGVELAPQFFGGFQQGGMRPGTEGVALAVGFAEALRIAVTDLDARAAQMQLLRDGLEQRLTAALPGTVVIGSSSPRLPNTSCVSFPRVDRQALIMALDLAGVACSTGSACASGSSELSPTLLAMGLEKAVVAGAIRLSLSAVTTAAEVAEAALRIINAVKHLQAAK